MNAKAPKLSIGLPVYNGARHLPDLLDSLRKQTFEDFEVIFVDNASTDATEELGRAVASEDKRFRFIRNSRNIGASPNFNLAFELGRGAYYKWCAHDDILEPAYLERCVAFLDADPTVSVAHTGVRCIDDSGAPLRYDARRGRYLDVDGTPAFRREPPGLARSNDPATRFDDVLHHMLMCTEVFGVMRTDLLRKSSLHGSYYGADKVLLAEMSILGRYETDPELLFVKRHHEGTSYFMNTRERQVWTDPDVDYRVPQAQVAKGYLKAISLAPLSASQRARCLSSVARKFIKFETIRRLVLPVRGNYLGFHRREEQRKA